MAAPGVGPDIPHLDLNDISRNWEIWHKTFSDKIRELDLKSVFQKLAYFSECIGPGGRKILHSLWPELNTLLPDQLPTLEEIVDSFHKFVRTQDVLRKALLPGIGHHTYSEDEVLQQIRENGKEFIIWSNVFPYLSLNDMDAVREADPKLRNFFCQYLVRGGNVTIDQTKDPRELLPFYADKTESLTLRDITDAQVKSILAVFPAVTELSLINLEILNPSPFIELPPKIKRLRIINCAIDNSILASWITKYLKDTLLELYIDREDPCVEMGRLPIHITGLNVLHTLHLRGGCLEFFDLPALKHLKIQDVRLIIFKCECPSLEVLHYDCRSEFSKSQFDLKAVRSITIRRLCSNIKELAELTELEHLRVLERVDLRRRNYLERIFEPTLTTLEIDYWDIPIEENLFFKLNEYCIRKILSHLPIFERITLGGTSEILHRIVESYVHKHTYCQISTVHLKHMPIKFHRWLYLRLGRVVTQLKIINLTQEQCSELLAYFPNITTLVMQSIDLIDPKYVDHFPLGIQTLRMGFGDISDEFKTALYTKFNPSLRSIDDEEQEYGRNELLLTNIREMTCYLKQSNSAELLQFLAQNAANMEKIEIEIDEDAERHDVLALWQIVAQMRNLRTISLASTEENITALNWANFPHMEEVTVQEEGGEHLLPFLTRCVPPNIKKLTVLYGAMGLERLVGSRFKDLREFELWGANIEEEPSEWLALAKLRNLEKLKIGRKHVPDEILIRLIKEMPQLKILDSYSTMSFARIRELETYFKEHKRPFLLNNVQF